MNPVRHHSNTRTLNAPAGWDQGDLPIEPLGITDTVLNGVPCVLSFWQPDAVDLANFAAGRPVGLSIVGHNMPPAALVTFDPEPGARPVCAIQVKIIEALNATTEDGAVSQALAEALKLLDAAAVLSQPIADVLAERARQDAQWGGPSHDDQHDPVDWSHFIEEQAYWGREQDPRRRFIKIAALAVAAIESIDRKASA